MPFLTFLFGYWRLIGGILAGIAVCSAIFTVISKHDDRIRREATAPLIKQLQDQDAKIVAQKAEAGRLLAEETAKVKAAQADRDARIAELTRGFNADKKTRDAAFDKLRADHGRLLDREATGGCGGGSGGAAGNQAGDAGRTPQASGAHPLSEKLEGLLWAVMRDADEIIAQYQLCQRYAATLSAP